MNLPPTPHNLTAVALICLGLVWFGNTVWYYVPACMTLLVLLCGLYVAVCMTARAVRSSWPETCPVWGGR